MKLCHRLIPLAFALAWASSAPAIPLTLAVSDPAGDHTGAVDVLGLVLDFDNDSGAYEIRLTATAANPFAGDFRVNVNLFNPDTGTTAADPSFFSDDLNDLSLAVPVTVLRLSGISSSLLSWDAGDRVAFSGPVPLGVPDGLATFRTAVRDLPDVTLVDYIARGEFVAIARSVPEPGTLALVGVTLCGYLTATRRRRSPR
ncbi:MAG: PEP-CTERM sorting domain-containing protein [Gammaproteobacteria bacterium]